MLGQQERGTRHARFPVMENGELLPAVALTLAIWHSGNLATCVVPFVKQGLASALQRKTGPFFETSFWEKGTLSLWCRPIGSTAPLVRSRVRSRSQTPAERMVIPVVADILSQRARRNHGLSQASFDNAERRLVRLCRWMAYHDDNHSWAVGLTLKEKMATHNSTLDSTSISISIPVFCS